MDTLILQSLSPAIAIALGVIAVMTQTAIRRHSDAALTISLVSLLIAVWAAFVRISTSPSPVATVSKSRDVKTWAGFPPSSGLKWFDSSTFSVWPINSVRD